MFSLSRISIDMSNDDHWHRRTVPVSTRLIYRSTAARRLLSLLCDCLLAPDAYVATVSPLLSLLSVCPTIALRRQTSFTSPPPHFVAMALWLSCLARAGRWLLLLLLFSLHCSRHAIIIVVVITIAVVANIVRWLVGHCCRCRCLACAASPLLTNYSKQMDRRTGNLAGLAVGPPACQR